MFAVVVTEIELGSINVYGPYRTAGKADSVAAMFRDPFAAEHFPEDEFTIIVTPMLKPE